MRRSGSPPLFEPYVCIVLGLYPVPCVTARVGPPTPLTRRVTRLTRLTRLTRPPQSPPLFFGGMKLFFFTVTLGPLSGWSHVTKKAPLTTVTFLLPVTGGHSGRNGKRACFFPVIFRSFGSLSVVTDGRTDRRTH